MQLTTRLTLVLSSVLLSAAGCSKNTAQPLHAPDHGATGVYSGPGGSTGSSHAPAPVAAAGEAQAAGRAAKSAPMDDRDMMAEEAERPGLGTRYGETHHSQVDSTSFERRRPRRPDRVMSIRYDDYEGVEAAAAHHGGQPYWGDALSSEAGLTVRLVDESGRTLPGGRVGGDTFALGHQGERYMLAVENATSERVEVVASVDGLDVIDGSDASFRNRGYVVAPWSSVQIDGWRTSANSVAAFRFSTVADSYASRTGRGRDVGVVGFAFFSEEPRWEPRRQQYAPPPPPHHDHQRDHANPFPGR